MATIRFFINAKKVRLAQIYVRVTFARGQRYICKTGLYIEPARWSNDTQAIRQRKLFDNDRKLIAELSALHEYLDSEVRISRVPKSKDWLSGILNRFHNVHEGDGNNLNAYIQGFIARIESGELKNTGAVNYVKGTVSKFRGFQGVFNRYQGIYTDEERTEYFKAKKILRPLAPVDFSQVNLTLYHDFVRYLSDEGYKVNTTGRFVKELKHIMHRALVEKKHGNREYEEFTGISEESHSIYLTTEEIEKIWTFECDNEREEIARDCFIVLCETALRISDYRKVDIGIRGGFIDICQTKTSGRVVIPLTVRMKQLLDKYDGKLPYIHENYVNKYVKTICFRLGFNEIITWPAQKYGKRFNASAPKWRLITCHTARRSGITNMIKAKIPIAYIMKISGHKTEKSLWKYVRITEEEVASELSQHPYFNQHLKVAK